MELVLIPVGKFLMGSPDTEKDRGKEGGAQHEVTISKPFYMGKYEVTQQQWDAVMAQLGIKNPSKFKDGPDAPKRPVEHANWDEACAFCEKLSQTTKRQVRLPTEAEWEYACRAGTTTRFSFGDSDVFLGAYAWSSLNAGGTTHPVGGKKPNPWGLYDIHGNVYEWCADDFHDSYQNAPADGRAWVDQPRPGNRVLRGGSWDGNPRQCRWAYRARYSPADRRRNIGLRCAVDFSHFALCSVTLCRERGEFSFAM